MDINLGKVFVLCLAVSTVSAAGFRRNFWKRHFIRSNPSGNDAEHDKVFFKDNVLSSAVTMAKIGESLVLECEAGGSPVPTIHWLFNGKRIIQGEDTNVLNDEAAFEDTAHNSRTRMLKLGSTRSRLYIDCVSRQSEGEYTCVAETPTVRKTKSTRVKIGRHRGALRPSSCNNALTRSSEVKPGRVYMWTAQRLELIGADVQLYCRPSGFPQTSVTWYDPEDNEIGNRHGFLILDNGDLLIKNIKWEKHMGLYRCHVENSIGYDDVTTFLYPTTR